MDRQDKQDEKETSCASCSSMLDSLFERGLALIVPKEKIAVNGECNLSGERYREGVTHAGLKWPLVLIGELCEVERGASPRPIHDFITNEPDGVNWIKIGDAKVGAKYINATKERVTLEGASKSRRVKPGDFILSNSMSFGRPYIMATEGCIHDGWLLLRDQSERLDQDYFYHILGSKPIFNQFRQAATGGVVNNLNSEIVRRVRIPLPPLELQKEIVAEIEGYQKVIDGARAVIDNYRPHITIHPDWPMVELGDLILLEYGKPLKADDRIEGEFPVYGSNGIVGYHHEFLVEGPTIIVGRKGSAGAVNYSESSCYPIDTTFYVQVKDRSKLNLLYCYYQLDILALDKVNTQSGVPGLNRNDAYRKTIPLPPLATQQAIVDEIEAEQSLVAANRELIARFEKKIQATLARVWGEDESAETKV